MQKVYENFTICNGLGLTKNVLNYSDHPVKFKM